jgi:hypothetical protein
VVGALPQAPEFYALAKMALQQLDEGGERVELPLHSGPDRCSVRSPAWTYPPSGCWKCISFSTIGAAGTDLGLNFTLTAGALS